MATYKKFKAKDATDFGAINSWLDQFDEDGGSAEDYDMLDPSEWIHSGSYLLNALISGSLLRGWANNKVSTIAGDPKAGKSYVLLAGLKKFQEAGYFMYFVETEGALVKDRLRKAGFDLRGIRIFQPETIEELIVAVTNMTDTYKKGKKAGEEMPKIVISIDSLNGMNSRKQYSDAEEKDKVVEDMGTVAKKLKQLFNMITVRSSKLNIPILCTAHVYDKQMKNFTERTVTGGNGALYLSSVLLGLRKRWDKDKETKEVKGVHVFVDIIESRFSRVKSIALYIPFEKPMNEYLGLQEFVSWERCGIQRGKFVDLVDFAYELTFKKQATQEDILDQVFSMSKFKADLAKAKSEAFESSLEWMVENGYIEVDPSKTFTFTEKIMDRFYHADSPELFELVRQEKLTIEDEFDEGTLAGLKVKAEVAIPLLEGGINNGYLKKAKGIYTFTNKFKKEILSPPYNKLEGVVPVLNDNSPGWVVKHLGKTVETQRMFNGEVFTREVLEQLDEYIRPIFEFGDGEANDIEDGDFAKQPDGNNRVIKEEEPKTFEDNFS